MHKELERSCFVVSFLLYGFFVGLMFSQMFFELNLTPVTLGGMGAFYYLGMKYA